ncbi:VTT domain-containing protein [Lysobacter silvisoli]|nr:VTT domain-containing protein [Lysobacter silvisoli]
MNRAASAAVARASWWRLAAFACLLLVAVLAPFALWGEAMDRAAPAWLAAQQAPLWLAALGIGLLVADVLLPVPSSVVAMLLCWSLGPLWGGAAVAAGSLLGFALGYALGRLLPQARLRRWIGAALWDRASARARERALWWIVIARPLPVLAELSALLAGAWGLPATAAFAHAALASCALGALYGASAWLGLRQAQPLAMLAAMAVLPVAAWCLHRFFLRRLTAGAGPVVPREHDGGTAP